MSLVPYEREREARIARNQQALRELGVKQAAARLQQPPISAWRRTKPVDAGARKRAAQCAPSAEPATAVRSSRRVRARLGAGDDASPADADAPAALSADGGDDDLRRLLSCDEWLERRGLPKGPLMTGHFTGWVEESVRVSLGLEASAAAAWEANGGGEFERRCPKGESAKEFARNMLAKNPNAYFYRLNVPGEEMWQGEWSEDEIAAFVNVALKHGCGNKWGLFASHIPHRVGYQCSAAYRHIIIPRGLLRDNNFKLTASGEAIWVGGRGGRGGGGST